MGKRVCYPSDTAAPFVSVVMSAYNVEKYIKEAIDSILSQTFGDFELIIIDDGSEDNTINIIKSYGDRRIRLIEMPHNFINSLNAGINAAHGKYIAKMDADDVMKPKRLEVQTEFMETHSEIDACGSYANYVAWSDEQICVPLNHNDIACTMLTANAIINPSSFTRRETLKNKHIRYNSDYIYAEDYEFWSDLIMQGCKLANIPYSLIKYRCREGQVTRVHSYEMCLVSERIKQEYLDYVISRLYSVGEETIHYIEKLRNMVSQRALSSEKMLIIIKKMYRNFLENE
jgi:glycosyltransferase involved in cell wall biosynthesis